MHTGQAHYHSATSQPIRLVLSLTPLRAENKSGSSFSLVLTAVLLAPLPVGGGFCSTESRPERRGEERPEVQGRGQTGAMVLGSREQTPSRGQGLHELEVWEWS